MRTFGERIAGPVPYSKPYFLKSVGPWEPFFQEILGINLGIIGRLRCWGFGENLKKRVSGVSKAVLAQRCRESTRGGTMTGRIF